MRKGPGKTQQKETSTKGKGRHEAEAEGRKGKEGSTYLK